MKIGIDAREFRAGRMTGIARYLLQFLNYAVSSGPPHEYVLFCNQHTRIPLDHMKLKKVVIPERFTPVWDQIRLPNNISREGIDIFLTPYFKAPLFLPCKMVLIINDIIPLFFPEEHGSFRRIYFRLACGMAARRAAKIITISENSKMDIVKLLNVPVEKITVVYLAVDDKYGVKDAGAGKVRDKYALPQKFILYVGNLSPHKNVKRLIESYAALPADLMEQYKLVLGTSKSGKYFPGIEKVIQKTGLSRDIFFTGFIEDEDLPAIYRMSSLFAFPSLYEGFGIPPLEAMACGVPVIASNSSSIPEVMGNAGLLINPLSVEKIAGAMEKVLTDEGLRRKMVQKGMDKASEFTVERFACKILRTLEEFYNERGNELGRIHK